MRLPWAKLKEKIAAFFNKHRNDPKAEIEPIIEKCSVEDVTVTFLMQWPNSTGYRLEVHTDDTTYHLKIDKYNPSHHTPIRGYDILVVAENLYDD